MAESDVIVSFMLSLSLLLVVISAVHRYTRGLRPSKLEHAFRYDTSYAINYL